MHAQQSAVKFGLSVPFLSLLLTKDQQRADARLDSYDVTLVD